MKLKNLFIMAIVGAMLSSCYGSKESLINDWSTLASETKSNHADYTSGDWEKVEKRFNKLQKKENHFSLTAAEKVKVTKAKATVVMYEMKEQGTSVLGDTQDLLEEGKKMIEDIVGDIFGK